MGKNTQQKTSGVRLARHFSAGGVVFKKIGTKIYWLIAKNNPSAEYNEDLWRLQKGWIDDENEGLDPGPIASGKVKAKEEDLQQAAIREVGEEGGVLGKIIKKIGTEKYYINEKGKSRILKFVTFYLMEYVNDLPEGFGFETEEVVWLKFEDAYKKLTRDREKQILQKAQEMLQ